MKHVIVIGAGMIGSSAAYRLARAGASVTMIDRNEPGSGTTGNSFAWVNANQKTPREYFELNFAGMKEHDALDHELGGAPWLHRTGNLVWSGDALKYDELHRRVERLQAWGYRAEWKNATEVNQELEPHLAFSGATMRIAWFPDESWLDGPLYVRSMLDRAIELGASVRTGQEVVDITPDGDQVTVSLSDGQTLTADAVLNSAGPASDRIAAMVDRSLPLEPTRGLLMRVEIEPGTISRLIHATDVNIRPDGEHHILIHHDSVDRHVGDRDSIPLDDDQCRELCRRSKRILPGVTGRRIVETRVGIRPYPADHVSCVGAVPGIPGYYEAVTHSGVTLGPLLGRLITEEILTGTVDPILVPFQAERFA
jgi:glycine/D-amino acid oxidase-like deaminating enzyme